ncbi:MAG: hypothetical protein AVDCRST_MAG58-4078 [uncultured Rubrobacteraceae bacterium]|uniref:Uncharacterized protein n=1 Tax=uncultured Rubrobacteraceae bacterium TaxID=349277 RepID=A0A6J4RK31_9ACTN|nr:MAG: hypothetical protein AVDCRST_MAG58-4078 [uncultured Rubrobacteraceae bacterium]
MLLIRCLQSGVHYWTLPSIGIALLRNFGWIDIIDLEVVLSLHKIEAEGVSSFTREAAKVRRANKRCEEEERLD